MRFPRAAVALGAALVMTTAACASSSGSPGSSASTDTGDVVIGASLSLSGGISNTNLRDGYQYAVDQMNAAGGLQVGGTKRPVALKVLDNRSDTNTMIQQVRSLVLQDNAVGLLGNCCQQNIDMVAQANTLKTPLVMGALPIELLPDDAEYAWDSFQGLSDGADYFFQMADQAGTNKQVVIITNNDAQGTATKELWSSTATAAGYQVVTTAAEPAGTTDYADFISKAQSGGAEVLVAAMTPPDCFAMWKQMKALAYAPKLAIGVQCAQTPGWADLGPLGAGTLLQTNWTPTSGLPDADKIVAQFAATYPNVNDQAGAAIGVHEASLLMQAISKAGSTDREAINKAIGALDGFQSTLGPVKWDGHRSKTPTFLGQWGADGKISQVWPQGEKSAQLQVPVPGLVG